MVAMRCAILPLVAVLLAGCSKPQYDTSTPEKTLDSIQRMVEDGRPELLAQMIEIPARDIEFPDGVTEESAIGEVKGKFGDMLAQLWRVSRKLNQRYPGEVSKELEGGGRQLRFGLADSGFGPVVAGVLADPFGFLSEQRGKLEAEDLGDGTATLSYDGEPVGQGMLLLVETDDGWRVSAPVELIRGNAYYPDTREEWSVIASMMLGVEGSLTEFEAELDEGKFRNLAAAGERAGRLLGESVVAQSIIYGMMKR